MPEGSEQQVLATAPPTAIRRLFEQRIVRFSSAGSQLVTFSYVPPWVLFVNAGASVALFSPGNTQGFRTIRLNPGGHALIPNESDRWLVECDGAGECAIIGMDRETAELVRYEP